MYFINANTGTVVADQGRILRTTDGGKNWVEQSSSTSTNLRAVSFLDLNNGTRGRRTRNDSADEGWRRALDGSSVAVAPDPQCRHFY